MWTPSRSTVILTVASASSLAAGCVSGYLYARRTLEARFEERLAQEIAETKRFFTSYYKVGEYSDPEKLAEKLIEDDPEAVTQMARYDTRSQEVPPEVLERVAKSMAKAEEAVAEEAGPYNGNAFDSPRAHWDQEAEEIERRNGVPYIISFEEFANNDLEHDQGEFTYYAGDDVLADSRDEVIPNPEEYVGNEALTRFGYGSNDVNIVFVRNEMMSQDFEISRSTKSYAVDVLGFQQPGELKHGDMRRFRKERDG